MPPPSPTTKLSKEKDQVLNVFSVELVQGTKIVWWAAFSLMPFHRRTIYIERVFVSQQSSQELSIFLFQK
jgi:hypothetical protein